MRSLFGKRVAAPAKSASPLGPTELSAVERSFNFRPGDCLSEIDMAMFPADGKYDLSEGYSSVGHLWEGSTLHLDPSNRVECVYLNRKPDGVYGLQIGMLVEEMRQNFPLIMIVSSPWPEHDRAERLVRYQLLITDNNMELLVTVRDGAVWSLALARAGYWCDPKRLARDIKREEAAARKLAEEESRLKYLRDKAALESERSNRWRTIADTDDMLDTWCKHAGVGYKNLGIQLRAASHSDWFEIVGYHNFDDGLAPLFWVVRQPQTELADVFEIFTLCEPDYFADPEKQANVVSQMTERDLIEEIRLRVESGFYSVAKDFDGVAAWDTGAIGRRDAVFMDPYRRAFRRQFTARG
jgi:hypothetical protein